MEVRAQRKLAAIVMADVVGYSRMMAADEDGTIAAIRDLRVACIEPVVAQHGGRVVKAMGDGFLMEFASAVTSVEAAIDLQTRLRSNDAEPGVVLRVGLHVGDIVFEDDDIFGDGVNVAARIEPLVSPGGIGISDEAYQQVRQKLDIGWVDGGMHSVKNIDRPLRIWHWVDGPVPEERPREDDLSLPDLPSVAVLPFTSKFGDPDQEQFADGLTEDLITDLSKVSGLFVVARNSTQAFKNKAADIRNVARQLGVANVTEGSVRKLGDRVRINVQLVQATTGEQIWADRFDGTLAEVFELQDQVCSEVVSALSVTLTKSEVERVQAVHTTNIAAYERYVQARSTPFPPIPPRLAAAKELFEQVVEMAPEFAGGYAGLSWITSFAALWGHSDPDLLGTKGEALAYKAIALDANFGWSQTVLGFALLAQRRFDEAVAAAVQGMKLLPNDADAHLFYAVVNSMRGNVAASVEAAERAFRLSPSFVNGPYLNVICHANFMAGNYSAAIDAFERNIARGGPVGPPAYCWAAASYAATGQTGKSAALVENLRAGFPDFRLQGWNFLKLIEHDNHRASIEAAFCNAGVPF